MPSVILDKFAAAATITITLNSLADSTSVGRQGTIIDNTALRFQDVLVFVKVTLGTSPTANRGVYIYFIRDDGTGTPLRTDNAGATDAAWTVYNAELIGSLVTTGSPVTNMVLQDAFLVRRPGPKWTIGVVNNTGVALFTSGQLAEYVGMNPESQ